jgi:hypothetical protein
MLAAAARRAWSGVAALWGLTLGALPHVLHHVGPLAGAALLAGAAGTALFGAIGLVAAIPFLLRLHRRFGTWRAPVAAAAVFAVMFSLSAFVVGPALTQRGEAPAIEDPEHELHHPAEDDTGRTDTGRTDTDTTTGK